MICAKKERTFGEIVLRLGRGVFVFNEDTHTLRLKSELFDLRVGYANPNLRRGESQRGVRILS